MNSSPLNNDLPGASIKNPLTLLSVFVLALFLRALDMSFFIKFSLISYVSLSILLMFKLLTLLKGFCLPVFAQEGSNSDLKFSRMPGNLAQYRVTVGIFNNQEISRNLKFEEFPIWKWSNNLFKYVSICSLLLFYIFLCSLCLSKESVLKSTILHFSLFPVFI